MVSLEKTFSKELQDNIAKTLAPYLGLGNFEISVAARLNTANDEMKKKAKEDPAALEALRGDLRAVSQEIKEKEGRLKAV